MVCTASAVEANASMCDGELLLDGMQRQQQQPLLPSDVVVVASGAVVEGGRRTSNSDEQPSDAEDNESLVAAAAAADDDSTVDTARMMSSTNSMSFQQQQGSFDRNKSSASIVSAYKILRSASVSSGGHRRRGDEVASDDKLPLDGGGSAVTYEMCPPDGGWGWMVLLGTVIVNTLIPGLIKSFGVLFVEFINVFHASPSSVAWIPALTFALYNLLGPVASMISTKYSCRVATFLGGLSATVGLALSYFADSIEYLYFSYGVLGGIGAGMSYTPGILIVGQYFNNRRGLANGICASGSALGSIILPPFLNYLLHEYGHRGAILIMCAIVMNVCVGAALYQPVEWHLKKVPVVAAAAVDDEINCNHLEPNKNHGEPKSGGGDSPAPGRRPPLRRPQSNPRFMPGLSSAAEEEDDDDIGSGGGGTGNSAPTVSFIVGSGTSPQNATGSATTAGGLGMGSTSSGLAPAALSHLHRSPSVVSTLSSSSFAYLSTIYLGSAPAAYQLNQIAAAAGGQAHRDSLSGSRSALPTTAATFGSQFLLGGGAAARCCCCQYCGTSSKCTCLMSNNGASGVVTTPPGKTKEPPLWKLVFDVALLKNSVFLLITYTIVASGVGYTNLLIMLPSYGASLGLELGQCALLLSVIAGADLVGRISGAWISDYASFPCKYLYMGGFMVSGVALMLLPQHTTFEGLALCCAVFGLFSGVYIGLMAVLLVNYLGAEKLGTSFGLGLAINGVVMITGPPLVSMISENIGCRPVLFILGVIILSGGLILVLEPLASGREQKKKQQLDCGKGVFV